MKSFANISALVTLVAVISFSSCTKSVSSPGSNVSSNDSLATALAGGSWVISSLLQKKEDNTALFAGYIFSFSSGGKLSASFSGTQLQGSWSHSLPVTYYGSSSREAMVFNMGTDNPFRHISKTWNIVIKSATLIQLESPEILEDEHLQLQKQ